MILVDKIINLILSIFRIEFFEFLLSTRILANFEVRDSTTRPQMLAKLRSCMYFLLCINVTKMHSMLQLVTYMYVYDDVYSWHINHIVKDFMINIRVMTMVLWYATCYGYCGVLLTFVIRVVPICSLSLGITTFSRIYIIACVRRNH